MIVGIISGMTVAVVYDQKILWKVGLGSAEMGPKAKPISPDNIFRIGDAALVEQMMTHRKLTNLYGLCRIDIEGVS